MTTSFLHVHKTQFTHNGDRIVLRGVNLGGWLMREGYIMHAPNRAVRLLEKSFIRQRGKQAWQDLTRDFRDNFIQARDLRQIADMGFNCVRVPFHYRLIEDEPYHYDPRGLEYLDRVIRWAGENKIWVILDLHAAPGAQNHDWHSDSLGKAGLWASQRAQDRVAWLWRFLARRYWTEPWVAGYDLLNEAVVSDVSLLNAFYERVIHAVRQEDKNHIIFLEGNQWATDLERIKDFDDTNLAYSIHLYYPLDCTFNFVPQLCYPLRHAGTGRVIFGKEQLKESVKRYQRLARDRQRPILVGEFGVNGRQDSCGEELWLKDVLGCFSQVGFSWTYWTYKAIKNSEFPDGVLCFFENPPWVHREGPRTGWETYAECWPRHRTEMARSWQTEQFRPNGRIPEILSQAGREPS